jgi:hypothetical protein
VNAGTTTNGRLPDRVLVDLSAHYAERHDIPLSVQRTVQAVAKELVLDQTIRVLPVVFEGGEMYALDEQQAAELLEHRHEEQEPPVELPTPSHHRHDRRLELFTLVARATLRYTPRPVRASLRRVLLVVRSTLFGGRARPAAIVTVLPEPQPEKLRLSCVVQPSTGDLLWTVGAAIASVPLRRLAEEKPRRRFRVTSTCFTAGALDDWPSDTPEYLSTAAARLIDQLDASDTIVCGSDELAGRLRAFALENGRGAPITVVREPAG